MAFAGEEIYTNWTFGLLWPRDAESLARVQARVRPYLPLWLLVCLVFVVSGLVYVVHCVA
jgi:hypothetical protein